MSRPALVPILVWVSLSASLPLALRAPAPVVAPGLDVLRERGAPRELAGRRVGLVTNHTGAARDGTPALAVLRDELGLDVVALFSPEHGFDGVAAAGSEVESRIDPSSRLPIHSLYGESRAPSRAQLEGVDVLVFDIQDVGVRFFTYASTMKLAMEAAASAGVAFVVLDRPNPNGGLRVEGPVLEPEHASFVGIAPIALLHGMTVGELASLFAEELDGSGALELTVVRATGWDRSMLWDDTGLAWPTPSPNLRTAHAAIAYPAIGLFEGVNVSEGRGVASTFELAGAPWIDGERLVRALDALRLPGVRFGPARFVPRSLPAAPAPRYRDEPCVGFSLRVVDPSRFRAVSTGLEALAAVRSLHPDRFSWVERDGVFWIDRLLGSDRVRLQLDQGMAVGEILSAEREARALRRFLARRRAHLLY